MLHRSCRPLCSLRTAKELLADAQLDWRDKQKIRFIIDNFVEGLAPINNPLISPLG